MLEGFKRASQSTGHERWSAARLGATPLLPGLMFTPPPPPPGEFVPGFGYRDPAEADRLAGYIPTVHRPNQRLIGLRWYVLPVINRGRVCVWCRHDYPCPALTWAVQWQAQDPSWWAM